MIFIDTVSFSRSDDRGYSKVFHWMLTPANVDTTRLTMYSGEGLLHSNE